MTLKEYLQLRGLSIQHFALISKLTRGTIYNLLNGKTAFPKTYKKILKSTKGIVKVEKFVSPKKLKT